MLTFQAKGVEGTDEQGMVGYEFFARFVTRFDYGKHTITFIDKKYFDPKDAGTPVPMRLYHQFPEILGSYDGIPGRFGIDTGSRMPLELNAAFAAKNDLRAKVTGGAEAMTGWGVGGPSRSLVFKGGTLKLEGVTIEHPLTMISLDKGGAGAAEAFPNNVGGGVLKRFVVTFDYGHSTMYLKPIEGRRRGSRHLRPLGHVDQRGAGRLQGDRRHQGRPGGGGGPWQGRHHHRHRRQARGRLFLPDLRKRLRNDKPGTVVTLAVKGKGDVKVTLRDLI